MKHFQSNITNRLRAFGTQAVLILSLAAMVSCEDEKPSYTWVDLRYKAEDSYSLPAKDAQPIKIQVKSNLPWEVYSQHKEENWCSITPATGDDPEQIYDVEIQYADNKELDDRIDTLIVRSDYWIGKWIRVKQEGTAYLKVTPYEEFLLPRTESSHTYSLESNQKWSVKVTEGSEWLSITGQASGEGDGRFEVRAQANNGAMRTAVIEVYDRHDVKQASIECKQDGVQLEIDQEKIKTDYKVKTLTLPVKSNTHWTASLKNEQDLWIELSQTEFESDAELKFSLRENDTRAPRTGVIVLKTRGGDGAVVVTREYTVFQAHKPFPERYEFTPENFPEGNGTTGWIYKPGISLVNGDLVAAYTGSTTQIYKYNNPMGRYKFRIHPLDKDTRSGLWFKADYIEFRFHLNQATGKTEISNNKKIPGAKNVSFDPTQPHDLEFEYTKGDLSGSKQTCNLCFYLDGQKITEHRNINVAWKSNVAIYIGSQKGTVTYDYMEMTLPVILEDL